MNRKANFIEWMQKISNVYQSNYQIDRGLAKVDDVYAPVLPSGIKLNNNTYATERKSLRRDATIYENSER